MEAHITRQRNMCFTYVIFLKILYGHELGNHRKVLFYHVLKAVKLLFYIYIYISPSTEIAMLLLI